MVLVLIIITFLINLYQMKFIQKIEIIQIIKEYDKQINRLERNLQINITKTFFSIILNKMSR